MIECDSLIAVPVRSHDGSVAAVLELLDKSGGTFGPTDTQVLRQVAELCAKEIARNVELAQVGRRSRTPA